MTAVYVMCFSLLVTGIICLLELTPEHISNDIMRFFKKDESMRRRSLILKGKKKSKKLTIEINRIYDALESTGKAKQFSKACAISLALIVIGCVVAVAIENPFMIPIFSVALSMIPFGFIKRTMTVYDKRMKDELETALSIITSSYIRTDDLVASVRENIQAIKPPVRSIFSDFLSECGYISSDIKRAIVHLKDRVKDDVFDEWCNILIACQEDQTLRDTLMPTVAKLTDMRIVNEELKGMLSDVKREYIMMMCLVAANIPILYFINKEWYAALMHTMLGKIVLAICGAAMIVTYILMSKYTKPIAYKR